jgi:hypothetical protein
MTVLVSIGPNRWIRKERRTRRFATLAVCWSLGMLVVLPVELLAGNSHWHNTVGNDMALGLFVVLAAPGFWLAHSIAQAGLWIGAEGIVVRGPVRTRALALAEADSFAPGVLAGGENGTPCPVLKRTHGPEVGVWALGREGLIWRYARYGDEMRPLCDELNDLLRKLKAGDASAQPAPTR